MALILEKQSDFGVNGNYWRIVCVESHYGGPTQLWPSKHARPTSYVHLAQYLSKEARQNGGMSLRTERVVMDGGTNGAPPDSPEYYKAPDYLPEPTRAAAYAALKTMPAWADAVDDA